MGPRWRIACYALGLALGAWIGSHREAGGVSLLEWLVLAAVLLGSVLALLGPGRGRPMTRRELEAAIQAYVTEHKRRFPDGG